MAYDAELPKKTQDEVRRHLSFILPQLKEPNTLIEPVKAALFAMQSRQAPRPWYTGVKAFLWFLISGLTLMGLGKLLGWN